MQDQPPPEDYSNVLHKTTIGYVAYVVDHGDKVELCVLVSPDDHQSYSISVPLNNNSLARLAEEAATILRRRIERFTEK